MLDFIIEYETMTEIINIVEYTCILFGLIMLLIFWCSYFWGRMVDNEIGWVK